MAIISNAERLHRTINWVHAVLQACEIKHVEVCYPIITALGAFTIAQGSAPFSGSVGDRFSFPVYNRTWMEPIFSTIKECINFERRDLFIFKELKSLDLKGVAATRGPCTDNDYCDEILPFLISVLERLNFSDSENVLATWACCFTLAEGGSAPLRRATEMFDGIGLTVTNNAKPLLKNTMPAVGRLFLEVLEESHPGTRYLNRVLGYKPARSMCDDMAPSFGLEF